jgi:hypothetical protein
MYSLGVCMQMMISETEIKREPLPDYIDVLNKVMKGLLEENWEKRMDATQISNLLSQKNIIATQAPFLNESKYLDALDQERKKKVGFEELYKRFGDAFLQKEVLKVALQEFENEKLKKEKEQIWFPIHSRLGKYFKINNVKNQILRRSIYKQRKLC